MTSPERRSPSPPGSMRQAAGTAALCCVVMLALAGCSWPGRPAPVVKIGVIAPFEGLGRPLGYSILPAIKVALSEANAGGELGDYRVVLVALNDDDDPNTAAKQAAVLGEDPDVVAVLGPWSEQTAQAAVPGLATAGLPALVPALGLDWPAGVHSLCPSPARVVQGWLDGTGDRGTGKPDWAGPDEALAGALRARSMVAAPAGQDPQIRFYTGSASQAARDLLRWRVLGWQGWLVGGPDLARPWYAGLVGTTGEGAQALVCSPAEVLPDTLSKPSLAQNGEVTDAGDAKLAYSGARRLANALARDIRLHGRASRSGMALALSEPGVQDESGLEWLELRDGRWVPMSRQEADSANHPMD